MVEIDSRDEDIIMVSMEISGEFENVMEKIQSNSDKPDNLEVVMEDLFVVLDAVVHLEGGTRSAIAQKLAGETSIEYDSKAVVDVLHVLERYELVVLDGNTWKPGPKAHSSSMSS